MMSTIAPVPLSHRPFRHALLRCVQWHNAVSPWNQLKPSLCKRVEPLLDRHDQPQVYTGIRNCFKMQLDVHHRTERHYLLNTFEMASLAVMRRILRPGDAFIDAGANLGMFTMVAARAVGPTGRVYAFEPQRHIQPRLMLNCRLNDLDNVRLIDKACWDAPGTAQLNTFKDSSTGLASLAARDEMETADTDQVETARIDAEVPDDTVRMIKIDVEGAEFPALRGTQRFLQSDAPPYLLIEINESQSRAMGQGSVEELIQWLTRTQPRYRQLGYIRSKRAYTVNRAQLLEALRQRKGGALNVFFTPDHT